MPLIRDTQGRLMACYETGEARERVARQLNLAATYREMNNLPLARKYLNMARGNVRVIRTGPAQ